MTNILYSLQVEFLFSGKETRTIPNVALDASLYCKWNQSV